MDATTLASLLGTAGAVIAGGIITTLVSVVKTYLPFTANWDGMVMAFAASAGLYVLVGISVGVPNLDAGFNVFMSWLACLATGIAAHKAVVNPLVKKVKG